MNILQEVFDSESFKRLRIKLVAQQIKDKRFTLTNEQLAALEEQITNDDGDDDEVTLEIPGYEDVHLQISVEEEDIARALDEHIKELTDEMPKFVEVASKIVLEHLRSTAPEMLAEHAEIRSTFEERLFERWGTALDLFEMFIVMATEAGEDFNEEFRPEASKTRDFVFDVLTRLHARSCQIANEILTLLKSGYADGAHARWRTLHEITVVGLFVEKFGQGVAERYVLHSAIESRRGAQQYQRYHERLGYKPMLDEELSTIEHSYQELLDRFGRPFANSYGWAAQATGKADPNFSDIERSVGLEHWRSHYKFASHNVHANPRGIFSKLGLPPERQQLLLTGPSDTGFTNPAHGATVSLLQITASLLTLRPNLDRLSICSMLLTLTDEIGSEFLAAQKRVENAP